MRGADRGAGSSAGLRSRRHHADWPGARLVASFVACLTPFALLGLAGCERDRDREIDVPLPEYDAAVPVEEIEHTDPAALERDRHDASWRPHAEQDRLERLNRRDTITVRAGEDGRDTVPASGDPADAARAAPGVVGPPGDTVHVGLAAVEANTIARLQRAARQRSEGASPPPLDRSVLRVQILLDRANFSPGVIDGRWGKNTEKAIFWFQHHEGLEATGFVDEDTLRRLARHGDDAAAVAFYDVRGEDLAGPFTPNPPNIYEKAKLSCLCHESPLAQIAESFRTTPALLVELNPEVDFDALQEGARILVPNVADRSSHEPRGEIAVILVSHSGSYTHALDNDGEILYHFPSTLGSRYSPSPVGAFHVVDIVPWPRFYYTPRLFDSVPDDRPEAVLPPGPNSPVGAVWIELSASSYGIHGTNAPETIGTATSHGCVRLTNWDAQTLAERVERGTPVVFR